jgi:8-oxo-dGTP diphosphatase
MIVLRAMAGAILTNGNDLLLIKRSEDRPFYPGVWALVGGHLEPQEINDPQTACLREIREETGIEEAGIKGFALQYIVLRRADDEIRISYTYIGATISKKLINSEEGELFWVSRKELDDKPMSSFSMLVMQRYLELGEEKDVMVGVLTDTSGIPHIDWLPLAAWKGL